PRIGVAMTDFDVIERIARIMQTKVYGPYDKGKHKPQCGCYLTGQKAAGWMMTLLPLMGQRRRSQIASAIENWKAFRPENRRRAPAPGRSANFKKKGRSMATCHPDRHVVGFGLCYMCWKRDWTARRKALAKEQGLQS